MCEATHSLRSTLSRREQEALTRGSQPPSCLFPKNFQNPFFRHLTHSCLTLYKFSFLFLSSTFTFFFCQFFLLLVNHLIPFSNWLFSLSILKCALSITQLTSHFFPTCTFNYLHLRITNAFFVFGLQW